MMNLCIQSFIEENKIIFALYQITVVHGGHHFDRGTVSSEMFPRLTAQVEKRYTRDDNFGNFCLAVIYTNVFYQGSMSDHSLIIYVKQCLDQTDITVIPSFSVRTCHC